MFERFSRSWTLVKASAQVLKSDRHLLVFPLVSGIAALLVATSFILPVLGTRWFGALADGLTSEFYVWAFLFYLVQYFVVFFFNTALVGAAMIRLDGGTPSLREGLAIAIDRWPAIFGYALIAATVGLLLRAIEQRAGFVGRAVVALVGVTWTLATFLTVPVLVARRVGPIDAVRESAGLLRRSWGENLIGNAGIGLAFGLLVTAVAVLGGVATIATLGAGMDALGVLIGVVTGVALLLLGLVQAALSGIYSAALYRYAVDDAAPPGFPVYALEHAFERKS